MKFLLAGCALLLSILPSQAQVLIYKGSVRIVTTAPPEANFPGAFSAYVLVDPDSNLFTNILFYAKDGKHQVDTTPQMIYFASGDAPGGKTRTAVLTSSSSYSDTTHFNTSHLQLAGTNRTLRFATQGAKQTVNFPATMSGPDVSASRNGSDETFLHLQLAMRFQSAATLEANDGGKTLAQATDDIAAELQKKGYMP